MRRARTQGHHYAATRRHGHHRGRRRQPGFLRPRAPRRAYAPLKDARIPAADAGGPSLAFGIRGRERRMLFTRLPLLLADVSARRDIWAAFRVARRWVTWRRTTRGGSPQANRYRNGSPTCGMAMRQGSRARTDEGRSSHRSLSQEPPTIREGPKCKVHVSLPAVLVSSDR